jgi:hypothetical protein
MSYPFCPKGIKILLNSGKLSMGWPKYGNSNNPLAVLTILYAAFVAALGVFDLRNSRS